MADIEIVGLHSSTNGRSCCQHACCGKHAAVNDVVRLVRTVVTVNDNIEPAIKVVKIADGVETCTIGFVRSESAVQHGTHTGTSKQVWANSRNL